MPHRRRHTLSPTFCAAVLFCVLAAAASAVADIVTLKTGTVLRGDIVTQDEKTVTLRMRHGTMKLLRSRIQSIRVEAARPKMLEEADRLLRAGKHDEAIVKLEAAVRRFPGSTAARDRLVEACRSKADALRSSGSPVEANRLYQRILELSVNDPEAVRRTKAFAEARARSADVEAEAKLLYELGRFREALEKFEALVGAAPDVAQRNADMIADCHAGYGRRLLELKRYEHARSEFDKAIKLNPKMLETVKHEVVVARFSPMVNEINRHSKTFTKARWETLAAELKALIALEDENPHLHFALGLCYQQLKRYENAAREYAYVLGREPDLTRLPDSLAPLQLAAQNKAKESPIILSFSKPRFTTVSPGRPRKLETEHFVIYHHNDELAKLVARGAEYYLRRNYRVFLDDMPERPWSVKCGIHLYRTQQEYLDHSRQASWSPAMASTRGIDGRLLAHHVKSYQTVENFLPSHLSHELTHIIHAAVVGYSGRIPIWLREGAAVRREPWFKRIHLSRAIRDAAKTGKLMTLEQILTQKGYPEEKRVKLFYAQSYALVETLEQAGTREQFTRFNREILRKEALEAARDVYGLGKQELVRRWKKHENNLIGLLENP